MFLRNAWYVAAWSGEVADAPLARTLLGELRAHRPGGMRRRFRMGAVSPWSP